MNLLKFTKHFTRTLTLVWVTLISACDRPPTQVNFQIDNPTQAAITVKIDATEYRIAPNSTQAVTLSTGVHQLTSPLTGAVSLMVYGHQNSKGVLVNPTFSTYVLMNEVYAQNQESRKHIKPLGRMISIDGVPFKGPMETLEGLFINRNWSFNLNENFPNEVRVYGKESGTIRTKIFRKMDFVNYFETEHGEPGTYMAQRQASAAPVAIYPQFKSPLHTFESAQIEAAAKPLKELYETYLKTTDPAESLRLQKAYFDLQMAFTKETAPLIYKLQPSEREAYNDFVMTLTKLLSLEARVLGPAIQGSQVQSLDFLSTLANL